MQKSVRKAEEMCQLIEKKVFIFQMSVHGVKNKLRCSEQGIRRGDDGMFFYLVVFPPLENEL